MIAFVAATYTVDLPVSVAVMVGLITLVGVIAAGVSLSRSSALRASLETITLANAELRQANSDLRAESAADRARFDRRIAEETEKRAQLEGRLQALTADLGRMIVDAVVRTVEATSPFVTDRPPAAGE